MPAKRAGRPRRLVAAFAVAAVAVISVGELWRGGCRPAELGLRLL